MKKNYEEISKKLNTDVDLTTQFIDDLLQGNIIRPCNKEYEGLLKFVIVRKWNSWYPCYFDTEGGCYAIITRDIEKKPEKNSGVIIIDPGIKYIENLRKYYNVEPHDVKKVIVSHYHQDHAMGLFELLTLSHEAKYFCNYYLNKTSFDNFKTFQGKYNQIIELMESQTIKLADYEYKQKDEDDNEFKEAIYLRTLKTYHQEIGNRHNSLGFKFNFHTKSEDNRELVILGDTDGNEIYHDEYMDYLKYADVVVLHLGSFSEKGFGSGNKHLYKNGLINIINCINCLRKGKIILKQGLICNCCNSGRITINKDNKIIHNNVPDNDKCEWSKKEEYFKNLQLVIITELGLEMATLNEFLKSIKGFKWFNGLYPILFFAKIYNNEDPYKEYFQSKTEHIKLEIDQKMKIPKELLSTISIDSLKKFSEIDDDSLRKLNAFNFSIFLSTYLWKLAAEEISLDSWLKFYLPTTAIDECNIEIKIKQDILSKLDANNEDEINKVKLDIMHLEDKIKRIRINAENEYKKKEINEKLLRLFSIINKLNTRNLKDDKIRYETFIEEFSSKINGEIQEYVGPFFDVADKFLKELTLDTCGDHSADQISEHLNKLSESLFYSMKSINSYDSKLKEASIQEYHLIAKSTSIFGKKNMKLVKFIKDRYQYDIDNFTPSLYLLAFKLHEFSNKVLRGEVIIGSNKCMGLSNDLQEILKGYSKGSVKYFIGSIGTEIDLSSKRIRIRSNPRQEFIDINIVQQDAEQKFK